MAWQCGIDGCGEQFGDAEQAIVHQTNEHERRECQVCGTIVPDGYFAIRHAFDEHTRAEYVRAYGADSEAVRQREQLKETIEREADLQRVVNRLNEEGTA
jgi:transcription initiation factor TFIIIB Brf1 subunit/transcription initiation factor TFIIB